MRAAHAGAQRLLEPGRIRLPRELRQEAPVRVLQVAERELDVLLRVLARQCRQRELDELGRLHAPIQQLLPERDPRGAARDGRLQLGQMLQEVAAAHLIEREIAVGNPAARRQYEPQLRRRGQPVSRAP